MTSEDSAAVLEHLLADDPPLPPDLHRQRVILGCWLLCLRLLGHTAPASWSALRRHLHAHRDILWGAPLDRDLCAEVLPALVAAPPSPAALRAAWAALPQQPAEAAEEDTDLLGHTYETWLGAAGRRGRGSYYTPPPLIAAVLQGALEPLTEAARGPALVAVIRELRVVDPACGSGRFLRAAARRLLDRLCVAAPDVAEEDAAALVAACLHGVDLDPLAVGLCRVQLLRLGLDRAAVVRRIRHGDALLGAPTGDEAEAEAWCVARMGGAEAAAEVLAARPPLHWHLAFPAVLVRGGFDVVLGNPPWIAHAGRAAQPLLPGVKALLRAEYAGFSGYPSTHGAFVERGASLLRRGGRLGLVVPSSVSELAGYRSARAAHDRRCAFEGELEDFGEGRFAGVTQPCMVLLSRRTAAGRTDAAPGSPWPMARPDLDPAARALLARLSALPSLPAALFGERGIQSDRAVREAFCESPVPVDGFTVPVREGSDVREACLLPPRLHVDPVLLGGRLRSADAYREVALVVRQTARFPVAACSDGGAFRNSLLAVFASEDWPKELLLVLLSTAVVRWQHYMRFRDARQPILPQLKVGHLRQIPAPPGLTPALRAQACALGARLAQHNAGIPVVARAALERLAAAAYGLTPAEQRMITTWAEDVGGVLASE